LIEFIKDFYADIFTKTTKIDDTMAHRAGGTHIPACKKNKTTESTKKCQNDHQLVSQWLVAKNSAWLAVVDSLLKAEPSTIASLAAI